MFCHWHAHFIILTDLFLSCSTSQSLSTGTNGITNPRSVILALPLSYLIFPPFHLILTHLSRRSLNTSGFVLMEHVCPVVASQWDAAMVHMAQVKLQPND